MLAPRLPSHQSRLLKRRADYFFGSPIRSRPEVAEFAQQLTDLGPVAVIGGFLRDVWLLGNARFESDVDFVVDVASISEFEHLVTRLGGKLNKFGGYGIELKRWKVDVWPLERTWAAVAGHVSTSTLCDLLDVTFFDWDAILYLVNDQKLVARQEYFDLVRERIIDINLEPNPNPLGNAVRALRYAYHWKASLGAKLASHVSQQIRDRGWPMLVASERRSFRRPVLAGLDGGMIAAALNSRRHSQEDPIDLQLRPLQNEIQLVGGDTCYKQLNKRRRPVGSSRINAEPALLALI